MNCLFCITFHSTLYHVWLYGTDLLVRLSQHTFVLQKYAFVSAGSLYILQINFGNYDVFCICLPFRIIHSSATFVRDGPTSASGLISTTSLKLLWTTSSFPTYGNQIHTSWMGTNLTNTTYRDPTFLCVSGVMAGSTCLGGKPALNCAS